MSDYQRVILVTGSNTGIGYQLVRILADKGHIVYLSARDETKGKEAQTKLKTEHGLEVKFVRIDVTVSETVLAAKDVIEKEEGRLDILVNNAGSAFITTPQYPDAVWDAHLAEQVFQLNFFSVVNTNAVFLPLIKKAKEGYGVILNVTSTTASNTLNANGRFRRPGRPDMVRSPATAYTAAKAALNAYTINLSHALQGAIKVNCATPGLVSTQLNGFMTAKPPTEGAEALIPWILLGPEDTHKNAKFGGPPEWADASGEMLW